ncbi:HTB2 [Symbiodinium pilosum]|uniref:HTB2 protein n=1 Tax=Symbiodinium pilosum TaxID=2952 RepID=A0A812J0R2_SYMPI|nr:HTB2 [Symbiodinium pilosum]
MSLKSKSTKMPPVVDEGESQPKPVKKKVKSKAKTINWGFYIMKVLRQVHPTLRISKQAMTVMISCVEDTFDRISMQANRLCRRSGSHNINTRDIQSAVRLVFPGELSRHAVSEGCKAVINHKNSGGGRMAAAADEEVADEEEEGEDGEEAEDE